MLEKPEVIYRRANEIVRYCGTRDTLRIARELGIYVHFEDDFSDLLGMYTYRHKERHILLNPKMDEVLMQMVCAHEIGHDALHRELAKSTRGLQEFVLFDMRTDAEYEAIVASEVSDKLARLSPSEQRRIMNVLNTMIADAKE